MSISSVVRSQIAFELNQTPPKAEAHVFVLGGAPAQNKKHLKEIVEDLAPEHMQESLLKSEKKLIHFVSHQAHVWVLLNRTPKKTNHGGWLEETDYTWFRDHAAVISQQIKAAQLPHVALIFDEADDDMIRSFWLGVELASYQFLNRYKQAASEQPRWFVQNWKKNKKVAIKKEVIEKAQTEAGAVQLARHLVNLPPNDANPATIENLITKELSWPKSTVKIDVWGADRLKKEGMNLHLAVGQGSETPPRMIHIQYRPKKKNSKKPVAFVGKGITFDTGGLDIKPSSAMRLMKKDMGGAASVLGLAYWVANSTCAQACDFYLALAENSVDAKAMRPSDVYKSRAGYLVEIDNTDAEGRLVLADVMDVAAKQTGANEPEILIDLATLTGAIKVALGADVAGLFSNDDKLAQEIVEAGKQVGEPNWRMPLVPKYFGGMSSHFADFKNSADGFGGAITAALFLEKFCGGKKWAHLDIYAWTDKATGPFAHAGGNGQCVQTLIEWLKDRG